MRLKENELNPNKGLSAFLIISVVHGVLLWALVPLAFLCWLVVLPGIWRRSKSFGQFLGWVDLNFIAMLQRLTPCAKKPLAAFVGPRDMASVSHRVNLLLDLW